MAGRQQTVWAVLVAAFLVLAAAGPVKMVRARAEREAASRPVVAGATGSATVTMVSLTFRPAELVVRRGSEVVFENADVAPHTVTSASGGTVDSGTLAPGTAFKLVVNDVLEYVCLIHPTMRGKILLSG